MGLSEREQKLLEELERGLYETDADFAKRVNKTAATPETKSAGRLVGGVILTVIGLSLLIVAVILQFALFGVVGFLVMQTGLLNASSNISHTSPSDHGKSSQGKPPGRSFFEDRWDRRQGD